MQENDDDTCSVDSNETLVWDTKGSPSAEDEIHLPRHPNETPFLGILMWVVTKGAYPENLREWKSPGQNNVRIKLSRSRKSVYLIIGYQKPDTRVMQGARDAFHELVCEIRTSGVDRLETIEYLGNYTLCSKTGSYRCNYCIATFARFRVQLLHMSLKNADVYAVRLILPNGTYVMF